MLKCEVCGTIKNSKSKPFTNPQALYQHILNAHGIKSKRKKYLPVVETPESLGLGMTELIAGDESDGVYWAMAHELGEWF